MFRYGCTGFLSVLYPMPSSFFAFAVQTSWCECISFSFPVPSRLFSPSLHNPDQVVERMVDFVAKGQLLGGRWLSLSTRAAIVSVTLLNATNVVFMAVYSHFSVKGWF